MVVTLTLVAGLRKRKDLLRQEERETHKHSPWEFKEKEGEGVEMGTGLFQKKYD